MPRGTWEPVPESRFPFAYRAITLYGGPFQTLQLKKRLVTFREGGNPLQTSPTTPTPQRLQAITPARFRLFPFRSPLLRESQLLSLPEGTEMFQFPSFTSDAYGFSAG